MCCVCVCVCVCVCGWVTYLMYKYVILLCKYIHTQSCLKAVLIHDVVGSVAKDNRRFEGTQQESNHKPKEDVYTNRIYEFLTAAEGGILAVQHNLISPTALHRVLQSINSSPQWKGCHNNQQHNNCSCSSSLVFPSPHFLSFPPY